jgi:hypothetical protein
MYEVCTVSNLFEVELCQILKGVQGESIQVSMLNIRGAV